MAAAAASAKNRNGGVVIARFSQDACSCVGPDLAEPSPQRHRIGGESREKWFGDFVGTGTVLPPACTFAFRARSRYVRTRPLPLPHPTAVR